MQQNPPERPVPQPAPPSEPGRPGPVPSETPPTRPDIDVPAPPAPGTQPNAPPISPVG
jgi:hypothetical protein